MSDVAQLLTAIAALVTATGGAVAIVLSALGSLRKQRNVAAEEAIRLTPQQRGRHEREFDQNQEFLRDLAGDMQELARGTAEMSRDISRETRLDRLEHPEPSPPPSDLPAGDSPLPVREPDGRPDA